jgi:CubicO group peptidase (beta-lactamase class C family)
VTRRTALLGSPGPAQTADVRSRRLIGALVAVTITAVSLAGCSSSPDPKPGSSPDRTALLDAINRQLELRPGHENVRAVLVAVKGKAVVERYDDVAPSRHWDIGWGTTAVVATLIGIAIDDGDIPGTDATLGQLLPDHTADMSPAVAATTLREVLTMTGGFTGTNGDDPVASYMTASDPLAKILRAARPTAVHRFAYSAQGAHVLSAILAKATGMPVLQYARTRLFDPLGIDTTAAGFAWPTDSTGLSLGWTGLALTPAELARIGQVYLDDGVWKGHRILSYSWVHQSTRQQVANVAHPSDNFSGYGGYGYGWWLIEADSSPAFFVADLSGQLLEMLPTHHLAVVVASEPVKGVVGSGVTPDALTFLVNDVIGPGVRRQ